MTWYFLFVERGGMRRQGTKYDDHHIYIQKNCRTNSSAIDENCFSVAKKKAQWLGAVPLCDFACMIIIIYRFHFRCTPSAEMRGAGVPALCQLPASCGPGIDAWRLPLADFITRKRSFHDCGASVPLPECRTP
ncbi:hypothetical protein F2P44_09745 [Massilia sp. CCM 8695]|uniref:Uncharacterized protein n=1 Tax=Massilia frigida TaxID=2609281 RepID=A0ABX0N9M5_9BURK|nr:hypothetical protein [Massilia frigida]NHZ79559.1 hypothetical protein [Massilia frigida]